MDSVPDRYRRTLVRGALVYRWVALAWMSALAASRSSELDDQVVAWASVGAVALWTLRLTTQGRRCSRADLGIDLALSAWLALASGLVVPERDILSEPLFASGYPLSTVFLWGIELGPRAGAVAGGLLAAAVVAARPLNDVPLDALPASEVQSLAGSTVNYLVAGVAVGLVARLLSESAHAVETANERLVRERERAARLAERESLARQIHDSVLQALALVHKRGRELAKAGTVPGPEVERLAEVAGRQEAELRALVLREPEDHPAGTASLRDALEAVAREIDGPPLSVSSVGAIWLERRAVEEVAAAVRQALCNVVEHARASRASVFAEDEDGWVTITVRDDGIGFNYDEAQLREKNKAGLLRSIKGRVEDLGGTMVVKSSPGSGTEVELCVPRSER